MRFSILRWVLLLPAFVAITGSCASHKEDAPAPAANTCSYQLDGHTTTGLASYTRTPYRIVDASGTYPAEMLTLDLISTIGIATEHVSIDFIKRVSDDDSGFKPLPTPAINIVGYNSTTQSNFINYTANVRLTLNKTSTNGFSGTFAGELPATSHTAKSVFTQGVFTDVHQK